MIWSRNINNLKPIGAPCQRLSPYQDWRKVFWQYICPTKGLLLCSIANRNMGYFIWSEYRKYLVTPDFMFRSSCTSFVSLHWFKSSADSSLHCVTISSYSKRYSGTLSPYAFANWTSSKDLWIRIIRHISSWMLDNGQPALVTWRQRDNRTN